MFALKIACPGELQHPISKKNIPLVMFGEGGLSQSLHRLMQDLV